MGVYLICGVCIEELSFPCGPIKRTIRLTRARVSLVKNYLSQVIIRIKPISASQKSLGYKVTEPKFFTKFLHEGKSTISIPRSAVNILLRDCPHHTLKLFLKNVRARWILSKNVRIKPPDLFKKNTSLSLLEEVNPISSVPVQGNECGKHKPPPHFALSPISSNGRKSKIPVRSSVVTSSTPIRKRNAVKGQPSIDVKENTFSHVLLDWQGKTSDKSSMSEQDRVIELVKSGVNVFCTGGAGTGKSYLLKKLIGILPPSETAVMASTGVAASLIGGTTVHAFAGIGQLLDTDDFEDLSSSWLESTAKRILTDPRIVAHWKSINRIIIDEVSMLSSRVFTRLEAVARIARGKFEEKVPFGGIQVVVFGDFFQLPPVLPQSSWCSVRKKFAFQSSIWRACCFTCVELKKSWRQSGDLRFFQLLNEVRLGNSPRWVIEALRSRIFPDGKEDRNKKTSSVTTRLCTHRRDADKYNSDMLKSLRGTVKVFEARDTGPQRLITESICNIPDRIELKVGAQVMLLRNLDVTRGLVNGARGVVESFTAPSEGGLPVVRFFNSITSAAVVVIQRERWTANVLQGGVGSKEVQVGRLQLPLCLAWAISIHKSQGITLDNVEVDLTKVFEHGQTYVALSRCRSLAGLRLLSWRPDFIRADSRVVDFYNVINEKSRAKGLISDFELC